MELKDFLDKQKELDIYIFNNLNAIEKQIAKHTYNKNYFLSDRLTALNVEVAELIQEVGHFKYWKKNKEESREKILDEFIDVFHFWLSIGNTLGFSPEEIEEAYMKKNKENYKRQDNGY